MDQRVHSHVLMPTVTEIERRFLVRELDRMRIENAPSYNITQGYINRNVRVRLTTWDGPYVGHQESAELTAKTGKGLSREERTESISVEAARFLIEHAKHKVQKIRYKLEGWEVDFFNGKLAGLVVAEKEMQTLDEKVELPPWILDATEVTETVTNYQLAKLASTLDGNLDGDDVIYQSLVNRIPRIVLTGAPCSGKSTAIRLLRNDADLNVHVMPETATIVMGELAITPSAGTKSFQTTLRKAQLAFEAGAVRQAERDGRKGVILDRGTLDSAAFVGGTKAYEDLLNTQKDIEFARYDKVIMLGLPSRAIYDANRANNSVRIESYEQAEVIERALLHIWKDHPDFLYVTDYRLGWEAKYASIRETIAYTTFAHAST